MKKNGLSKSAVPAAVCASLCLTGTAYAQTPAQFSQLGGLLANRAEVGVILGATDAAGGGSYTVDGTRGNDDFDFSLYKFGGGGEIGKPRALGDTLVTWRPYVFGNIGYISGDNDIDAGPLAGNDFEESALGIQFGGGVSLNFTERFTVTPFIGMLYGHYEAELDGKTPAGQVVEDFLDDEGSVDAIGVTPGVGMAYRLPLGPTTVTLGAKYTYYGTTDIGDSDIEVEGSSHIVEGRVDVDVPLNAQLWGCRLHTGGYVALTKPFGDIEDTMRSDWWGTIHPRLLLDTSGKLWKVDRIGLGASYIKGEHFDGWDVGIDMSFKF